MAVLTHSGRAALAAAVKEQTLFMAVGRGNPAWGDTPPPESVTAAALTDEVLRRRVTEVHFVAPDPDGEVSLATGRYRISATPTQHLFVRCKFDFQDAAGVVLREQAIFVGTQTNPSLPAGQMVFTPDQLINPGVLLLIEHSPPIHRQASTRETFEFVITF